jgi:hypothetical protein
VTDDAFIDGDGDSDSEAGAGVEGEPEAKRPRELRAAENRGPFIFGAGTGAAFILFWMPLIC